MKNRIILFIIIVLTFDYSYSQNDSLYLVAKNTSRHNIAFPFIEYNKEIYLFSYYQSNDTLYIDCKIKDSVIVVNKIEGYSGFNFVALKPKHKFKFRIYYQNEKKINYIVIYISNFSNYTFYFKRRNDKFLSKQIVHLD